MHSIKKAARREAWYNSPGSDVKTYNFFGRLDTRIKRPRDAESGIHPPIHIQTDPSPITSGQSHHYGLHHHTDDSQAGSSKRLERAGTAPVGSDSASHDWVARGGDAERGTEKLDDIPSEEISKDGSEKRDIREAGEQNGVTDKSVGPSEQNGIARKRKTGKVRKFLPCIHSGKEDDTMDEEEEKKAKKKHEKIPFMNQFKAVFGSWVNILLVFVPIGIAMNYAKNAGGAGKTHSILVFVFNFLAIVPLAGMLSFATEELAMYIGEVLGGLLNASFGNAVELIVGVIALAKDEILIVQTSLIGSMLSNLLLVMGMCFFFGGLKRTEQFFNLTVAQTAASLLAVAIGSLVIPTAFVQFSAEDGGVIPASRGTAVMLLFVYGCYLLFQLRTHSDVYNAPSQKVPKKQSGKKDAGDMFRGLATIGAIGGAAPAGGEINKENLVHDEDDEEETPQLSITGALVTLAGATVLIALCAEFMVGAINDVADAGVSKEFIGLILLPIVGNAAEHATAVTVAIKDKMDLAIGVAVGSSLQIALLVLPLTVLLSWFGVGRPDVMSLSFDGFQIAVLFISIILVNYLIQDGRSHWLEGVMLQVTYLIIAVMAWFYPAGNVAG
ncbi:Hypothetical protein R9X50_00729000 [Acrodontium crateriforme]|uniref:Sodium/calcium exchanger membrane region domain-containing protein n=1 Tax=Acrodontium crateriforme TaxID=150365 RepID=A0AAQ3M9X6_9PEZI|nr:Hypothetical protein R9X50_00729000 [Acrodontium crateriforme]